MTDIETTTTETKISEGQKKAQWQELRDLIAGPEQRRIDALSERLDDPIRKAEEISKALPDAMAISHARDDRLARAIQPTIDKALKQSVEKNPKAIANAIFPILGPAIRKAISATVLRMVQSLNQILNQSFSSRGLRWRWQAWQTRTPFAQVVLLHTLVYRVEQIFLIHRKTGLLLAQASTDQAAVRDPDLVSGMLTAIQDFVRDSFDSKEGEALDTLRMDGNHSVWIEQGPEAILAVVIQGTPPLSLREHFQQLLDDTHMLFANQWEAFSGDITPFTIVTPQLEDALTLQVRDMPRRTSPMLWIGLAVCLLLIGILGGRSVIQSRRWQSYLDRLRAEAGIVVLSAGRQSGRYFINGLYDPLAGDPQELTTAAGIDPDMISSDWQRFHSLDDSFTRQRALNMLTPPDSVRMHATGGVLSVSGEAPHSWVIRLQRIGLSIPGVERLDAAGLLDREMADLSSLTAQLQKVVLYFDRGSADPDDSQAVTLARTVDLLSRIQTLKRSMGVIVQVVIVGHADPIGSRQLNARLSLERARRVFNHLIRHDIDPIGLLAVGDPVEVETDEAERLKSFRTVTFKSYVGQEPEDR